MAHVGMGEPFIITQPEGAQAQADRFRKMIQSPVLTNIRVDFGDFQAYEVEPPSVPDLLAQRPVLLCGKWRGRLQGQVILRGSTAGRSYLERIDLDRVRPEPSYSSLRYLWARQRIALLSDYNHLRHDESRAREVTQLGLTYNLLTAHTSFVAVDTQVSLVDGKPVIVKQPLPLPEGVSDYAVGEGSRKGGAMRAKAMNMAVRPSAAPSAPLSADLSLAKEEKGLQDKPQPIAPARVLLRLAELKVTGGISEEKIRRWIEQELSSLELCLQSGSKGESHPTGKVVLQFSIDQQGRTGQVSLSRSELKRREIEECLLRKIRQLRFPTPQEHRPTSVFLILLFP